MTLPFVLLLFQLLLIGHVHGYVNVGNGYQVSPSVEGDIGFQPTIIVGNLIIDGRTADYPYLQEITGYLSLKHIQGPISFPRLAVIHGEELDPKTGASLAIVQCSTLYVPRLQVIKKGKVFIYKSNNCYWNPALSTGVDYRSLVRSLPNQPVGDIKIETNSLLTVVDSFNDCKGKEYKCKDSSTARCVDADNYQKLPTASSSPNGKNSDDSSASACQSNCAAGCRTEMIDSKSVEVCNTCSEGMYLSLDSYACVECPSDYIMAGLYCMTQKTASNMMLLLQDKEAVPVCSVGFEGVDNKCVRCDVDYSPSEKLFSTCPKMCFVVGALTWHTVNQIYPRYHDTYLLGEIRDEHLLCKELRGQLTIDNMGGLPPSSLWFLSRLRKIDSLDIKDVDNSVSSVFLFFGNLESVPNKLTISINHARFVDLGLLSFSKNQVSIKQLMYKPFFNRLNDDHSRFSKSDFPELFTENEADSCQCPGGSGPCFVQGNCFKCAFGHEQFVDPVTLVLHTRCSEKNETRVTIQSKYNTARNFLYTCHSECVKSGVVCDNEKSYGCRACANYGLYAQNLPRMCVKTCPMGFYADEGEGKRCHRCHGACRGGCTGGASYRGKGGCNACFTSVSAPKGSGYDAVCMKRYTGMHDSELFPKLVAALFVKTYIADAPATAAPAEVATEGPVNGTATTLAPGIPATTVV